MSCRAGWCAAIAVAAGLVLPAAAQEAIQEATKQKPCAPDPIGSALVRAAADGLVLVLDDGREFRLAGIEVPQHDEPARQAARDRLHAAAAGRPVRLGRLGTDDRYGRLVGFVYGEAEPASLQEAMLEQGHARVAPLAGHSACARLLLAAERGARAARRGLWGERAYAVRRADRPEALRADLGRFVLVEGEILSVRAAGALIYLNFSRRWTAGFTAAVLKRNAKAFAAAGIDLAWLAGRTVTVRGVLEERGGLRIELAGPEQIELSAP